MKLGAANPVWRKLYEVLSALAAKCGAVFAFVIDEGNGLWCVGLPGRAATTMTGHEDRAADRFYEAEMVPRMHAMRRVRARVRRAMPKIEALTLACSWL